MALCESAAIDVAKPRVGPMNCTRNPGMAPAWAAETPRNTSTADSFINYSIAARKYRATAPEPNTFLFVCTSKNVIATHTATSHNRVRRD